MTATEAREAVLRKWPGAEPSSSWSDGQGRVYWWIRGLTNDCYCPDAAWLSAAARLQREERTK